MKIKSFIVFISTEGVNDFDDENDGTVENKARRKIAPKIYQMS